MAAPPVGLGRKGMNETVRLRRLSVWTAAALAFSALFSCSSGSSRAKPSTVKGALENARAALPDSLPPDNLAIDFRCDAERIRNARAPFHWSYKKIVPPLINADWEVDITPLSILGSVTDGSGTRLIHGIRADDTSWNTSLAIVTGALPGSTFALVNHSSAIVRAGNETVHGERTTRYTIDTSRDMPADASLIRNVLGPSGFVKGAAWVNAQGCPIEFVLNVEQHNSDGSVQKEHYEANVTQP